MPHRAEVLSKLAWLDGPSQPLIEELRLMDWDWTGEPLLVLTPEHVLSVMDRFLSGQLTAKQVEDWADALELREDVELADSLAGVIFYLANPSINGEINETNINRLRQHVVGG